MSNPEDHASHIDATAQLREQQVRGKGLFAMLVKGLQLNVISVEFIKKYFQIDFKAKVPQPVDDQQQYGQQELVEPHLQQILQLQQSQQLQQQQQLFQQQSISLQEDQLSQEQDEQQQQIQSLDEERQQLCSEQSCSHAVCRKRRRSI